EVATMLRINFGMHHREAAHVQFIDDRLPPWDSWRGGVAPREGGLDHPAFPPEKCTVAPGGAEILPRAADPITDNHTPPLQLSAQRLGVGIDQQLVVVEA